MSLFEKKGPTLKKNIKLNMPELYKRWKLMSDDEKAPFKETALQEKNLLIANGTYRVNRKGTGKPKEVKLKDKRDKRAKEKKIKNREKETSLAIIERLTNNNKNLAETVSALSQEILEERRKRESFQKIAMDCQKAANEWKEKFIVVLKKNMKQSNKNPLNDRI